MGTRGSLCKTVGNLTFTILCFLFFVYYHYLFLPTPQNIVPNNRAITVVQKYLTAVYGGFLQYDILCFHRQAKHCVRKVCEYSVGKDRSVEPSGGVLNSFIKVLFLLKMQEHDNINDGLRHCLATNYLFVEQKISVPKQKIVLQYSTFERGYLWFQIYLCKYYLKLGKTQIFSYRECAPGTLTLSGIKMGAYGSMK